MSGFDTSKTLTVRFVGDTSRLNKSFAGAYREAQGFGQKMAVVGNQLKGMMGPALLAAGAAAGAFAIKLGVDGVQAAMEEEKQLAILKQTLDNVGQGFAMDEVNTFIDNLRFATGVADDELRPAFMKLVGATKDASTAQDLLKASVDASVGSGKDLSSVSQAVAKAVAGSSTALKKLIPELDATALKGGGAARVVAALTSRFGGSAAAAAGTFAGQLQRLQDGFAELQESFGKGFLDQLDSAKGTADGAAQALRDLQPVVEQLGASFGGLFKTIADNRGLIEYFAVSIGAQVKMVSLAIDSIGIAWKSVVAAVTGSWPEDETQRTTKSVQAMAYQIEHSGKGAGIMAAMFRDDAAPATNQLGDSAYYASDQMSLLREDIRLATRSLGPLAAAFDEANAAMNRRQAMQDYRDALKAFIEDPSAETRDAVVASIGEAFAAFDDPKKGVKFAGDAINGFIGVAKDAGVSIPPEVYRIQAAWESAVRPIDEAKKLMEGIPRNIPVTVTVTTVGMTPEQRREWYGSATGGPVYATGGMVRAALGTHASDNIPAMLSRGEYVLNADTVKRLGVGTLNQLNNGGGAGGGLVINGGITVNSATGERAEESVPRALRRMAFVAGLNG